MLIRRYYTLTLSRYAMPRHYFAFATMPAMTLMKQKRKRARRAQRRRAARDISMLIFAIIIFAIFALSALHRLPPSIFTVAPLPCRVRHATLASAAVQYYAARCWRAAMMLCYAELYG
jgi:sulfite exporter TauE/SafE